MSIRDLFKQYLELEPNESQFLQSLISIPWCLKIFYGLIADNLPIMGSNRKSYIILNSLVQAVVLLLLAYHF